MRWGIRFDTGLGNMTVVEEDGGVAQVYFTKEESQREFTLKEFTEQETPLLKKAKKQLQEYCLGKRKEFDLPLAAQGTEFQNKVWDALCTIPYGETRSYKQIAEQVNNPKGCRAVGMANHNNPISIIVPCHRVVGSNGSLTGYAGGLNRKKTLLNLEQSGKSDEEVKLTQMSKTAGCAAKIGPGTLAGVLESLPKFEDPNLIVGIETSDDGAVYKVSDELALIQTLDFFTPVVDDPYTFGQVAAANALSDIYAMGGEPKIALNIVAWPNCVNPKFLGEILRGGADKVKEAGAVLAGGHSIQDEEPKYGLSVTGFVHPDKIFKNCGARPGDVLILTKPLGTGIVNTAVKAEMASAEAREEVVQVMTALNKKAKQVIENFQIHSCTDVTGFGLAGHSMEMAEGSGVTLQIHMDKLPIQQAAIEYAQMGLIPAGAYKNRSFTEARIDTGGMEEYLLDIFFDPQTSGGLLISVAPEDAEMIMKGLEAADMETSYGIIGEVVEQEDVFVRLMP